MRKIFDKFRIFGTETNKITTHTWLSGGKYHIGKDDEDEFYELYTDAYNRGEKLEMIEMQLKDGANILVIDIDLELAECKRSYTKEHLAKLAEIYTQALKLYLNYDNSDEIVCIIFERNAPYIKNEKIKDGVHMMFYKLRLNHKVLHIIRNYVIKHKDIKNILEEMGAKNTVTNVIDKSVIDKNGWFMYGSGKTNIEPYQLTYVYIDGQMVLPYTDKDILSLIKSCSIRRKLISPSLTEEGENALNQLNINKTSSTATTIITKQSKTKDEIPKYLKKALTLWSKDEYTDWFYVGTVLHNEGYNIEVWKDWSKESGKYKEGCCEKEWKKFKDRGENKSSIISLMNKTKELYPAEYKLIEEEFGDEIADLHKNRNLESNLRNTVVGMRQHFPKNQLEITEKGSMKFIDEEGNEYYSLELADKYCPIQKKEDDNTELVADIRKTGLQLRSLESHIFNKKYPDNPIPIPDKFKNLIFVKVDQVVNNNNNYYGEENINYIDGDEINIFEDKELNKLISKTFTGSANDIACLAYYLYKNKYRYEEVDDIWYYWDNHIWKKDGKIYLFNDLSHNLVEYYDKIKKDYNKIKDDAMRGRKKTAINKILMKLKEPGTKENIQKECKQEFYMQHKDFSSKLNENRYLMGFKNGIYDFKNLEFRDGKQDDCITKSTKVNYKIYTKNDDMEKFIKKIFPDKKIRRYVMKFLATTLIGINKEERFHIFCGSGSNGKSKLMELLSLAMGEYYMTGTVSYLTGKRQQSNQATPEMIESKGKRIRKKYHTELWINKRIIRWR